MADVEIPNPDDVAEQAKNQFTRRVALSIACFAVILAIASLGGSNAGKDGMLSQQKATNQWAYYQAQVVREHQYRIGKLRLELDLAERESSMTPEVGEQAKKLLARFESEEKRYSKDKQDIKTEAEGYQEQRDVALAKDPYFDYAEALLQIAIVLASVAMLAGSRPVYLISVVVALLGTFLAINGFTLLVKIPFLSD
jgi:hypothetical protein